MSLANVVRTLSSELSPVGRSSRMLYRFGAVWLLVGVAHVVPLAASGWVWSGSLSWRKPIVFSVSIGLLLATIGWVMDRIHVGRRPAATIAWALGISSSVEVGLITVQTWRGEASHFNVAESSNATIFALMGAAVGVMSLCIVVVFVWSLVRRPTERLVRIAVIAGLAILVTSLGLGQWIIQLGVEYVERFGAVPETVTAGEEGVAKFPHALALHGIQLFILYALLLKVSAQSGGVLRMRVLVVGYATIVGSVVMQTMAGYGPTHPTVFSASYLAAFALVAIMFASAVRRALRAISGGQAREAADMLSA